MATRTHAEMVAASDKAMYEAAISLIAREGVSSLSIHKVGSLAGYTKGVVVHRFKTKVGLMKAVAEKVTEVWENNLKLDPDEHLSAMEQLKHMSSVYLKNVERCDDLMLAFFRLMQESHSSCPEIRPEFAEYDLKVRERLASIVEIGKRKKEFRSGVNAEAFAIGYIGMLRGIALQFYIHDRKLEPDLDVLRETVDQYCDSLCP